MENAKYCSKCAVFLSKTQLLKSMAISGFLFFIIYLFAFSFLRVVSFLFPWFLFLFACFLFNLRGFLFVCILSFFYWRSLFMVCSVSLVGYRMFQFRGISVHTEPEKFSCPHDKLAGKV